MKPVVIRVSRWRSGIGLCGCLAILAICSFTVAQRGENTLTIVVIVVSAATAAAFTGALQEDTKRMVIDEDGVWNSAWRIGVVRWKELNRVFVRSVGGEDYICFSVLDRDELRRRLGLAGRVVNDANRATGFGDLNLNATRFGLSVQEVVEFASKKIAES